MSTLREKIVVIWVDHSICDQMEICEDKGKQCSDCAADSIISAVIAEIEAMPNPYDEEFRETAYLGAKEFRQVVISRLGQL